MNKVEQYMLWIGITGLIIYSLEKSKLDEVTPIHEIKPVVTCYSAFDVYQTDEYTITDDNATLITSHGRVYHREECK